MQVKMYHYYIPSINGEGWGEFILSSTGMFSAVTDYGDYIYQWRHFGNDDIRSFITKLNNSGYLLTKVSREEYSQRKTVAEIKEYIYNVLSPEMQASELDILDQNENLFNEYDFYNWYQDTKIDDPSEFYYTDHNSQAKAFAEKLFPRLQEEILKELKLLGCN